MVCDALQDIFISFFVCVLWGEWVVQISSVGCGAAVKKSDDTGLLPLECPYLCRAALASVAGQQTGPAKYFTLRRKPKSAALRADILQKCESKSAALRADIMQKCEPGDIAFTQSTGSYSTGLVSMLPYYYYYY